MQRKKLDEHLGAFLPPLLSGIRLAPKHLQPATFRSCVPLLVAPCMSAILSTSDQSVLCSWCQYEDVLGKNRKETVKAGQPGSYLFWNCRGGVGRADYFESTHDEPNLLQSHRSAAPEPAVVASCRLEERFEGK